MNSTQIALTTTIARHCRVQRAKVKEYVESLLAGSENACLTIDFKEITNAVSGDPLRVVGVKIEVKLGTLFYWKHFEKTSLYATARDYLDAGDLDGADVVVFVLGGTLMSIRQGWFYEGLGGILIKNPNSLAIGGFCVEPLDNYLQYAYPVQLEL